MSALQCLHIGVGVGLFACRCRVSCTAASIIPRMHSLPSEIYSVASVREIDRCAIEDEGVPGYTLMTRAAAGRGNGGA